MSGKVSPTNELIEGWMEIKSHYANNRKDNEAIRDDLLKNQDLDFRNDQLQREGMKHLEEINHCLNIKDYVGASKHTIAAIQKFTQAMQIDLIDDRPRSDALIKCAEYIEKSIKKETEIKGRIGAIKSIQTKPDPTPNEILDQREFKAND